MQRVKNSLFAKQPYPKDRQVFGVKRKGTGAKSVAMVT